MGDAVASPAGGRRVAGAAVGEAAGARPRSDGLAASRAWCRAVTRRHARSFYFSSLVLPEPKRQAAYAIYAFCRHADDAVDGASSRAAREEAVVGLHGIVDRLLEDPAGVALPFAPALADTLARYPVDRVHFRELVEGVAMDVGPVRIPDWPALRTYCYHVASTVGLVMAPVFGLRSPEGVPRAVDLGIAMQLTNICRDIREDGERGRTYLPADELARFGVDPADLRAQRVTPGFVDLMRFQIRRARDYYRRSEPGIGLLEPDGSRLAVWSMRWIYADILREIERQEYDVFRWRAATGTSRKLLLLGRAWGSSRRG